MPIVLAKTEVEELIEMLRDYREYIEESIESYQALGDDQTNIDAAISQSMRVKMVIDTLNRSIKT